MFIRSCNFKRKKLNLCSAISKNNKTHTFYDWLISYIVLKSISESIKDIEGSSQPYNSGKATSTGETVDTTTIMEADIDTTRAVTNKPLSLLPVLLSSSISETPVLTLAQFLSKPLLYNSGFLQSSDVFGTFSAASYPAQFYSNSVYLQKLRGFMYFRGTLVITIQVNASPMHQGIYRVINIPNGGLFTGDPDFGDWNADHASTIIQRSQLQHVEIDLAVQTSGTLKIPFVSAYSASVIGAGNPVEMGIVQLIPIVPTTTGVSTTDVRVGYSLWCHFEDVELSCPVAPHSGNMFKGKFKSGTNPKTTTESEQDSKNIGPVTTVLQTSATIAKSLAAVPLLSDFAGPVGWFCDMAAGVTSIFGWSKPVNVDVADKVVRDCFFDMQYVDGADNSKILALSQKNQIEVLPGFGGSDLDELTFNSFLTRPTIMGGFNWTGGSTPDLENTTLFTNDISPRNYVEVTSQGGHNIYHFTPIALVASYFTYWRGNIRFTFHLAKTNFHSGRLMFVYNPYQSVQITDYQADNVDSVFCWRHIVDIRTTNVVSLVIPFTSVSSYRTTNSLDAVMGNLQVRVLDPLINPQTAADVVRIVWSVAAEPEFEFAVPRANIITPVDGITVSAAPNSASMFEGTFISDSIGNSAPVTDSEHESARKCIGEKIISLRQLAKRSTPCCRSAVDPPFATNVGIQYPFADAHALLTGSTLTVPPYYGDFLSVLNSMFTLSRGSVRIKQWLSISTGSLPISCWLAAIDGAVGSIPQFSSGNTTDTSSLPFEQCVTNAIYVLNDLSVRCGMEVQIPPYGRFHSRVNGQIRVNTARPVPLQVTTAPSVAFCTAFSSAGALRMSRAGGDDYNVGQWVSIPPMVLPPNTA